MKLPRDLSGADLIKRLERFEYAKTRQSGSHVRLTTKVPSTHHITSHHHPAALPVTGGHTRGYPIGDCEAS